MNSFLELHSDIDYRNTNRPYYKGTWEYTHVSVDRLIPFQFLCTASDYVLIQTEDEAGSLSNITAGFYYPAPPMTLSWSKTGGGTWSINPGSPAVIQGGTVETGGYMTSGLVSLTSGSTYFFEINPSTYTDTAFTFALKKGATTVWTYSHGIANWVGKTFFEITTTGSDYTFVITNAGGGTGNVTTNTPDLSPPILYRTGSYWTYKGEQLMSTTLSGVFRLKLTCGASIFYSDWCEASSSGVGFTGLTKIALTSSYDYGGIKYVGGYSQWIYKDASVRRGQRAEIEVTGDRLNGQIVEEKKVAAIRYKITMKCTESEYEAFVHAMGGTLTITDPTGRVFNAVNVELSDATWYYGNGICELSFVDSNNVNLWTRNNSAL